MLKDKTQKELQDIKQRHDTVIANGVYKSALNLISCLMEINPDANTSAGHLLKCLAKGIQEYEQKEYPHY